MIHTQNLILFFRCGRALLRSKQAYDERMANTEMILDLLRDKLLALHKTLVDIERAEFERANGPLKSVDFLTLLMQHPDFAWLRKISELIVWIDEVLDPKEMTADVEKQNVLEQAKKLLNPSELGEDFVQKYHDALQKYPDVVIAHQEVRSVLKLSP